MVARYRGRIGAAVRRAWDIIMTRLRRVAAHAVASIVFALATFCIFGGLSQAAAIGVG
jgi:hypothetical protein